MSIMIKKLDDIEKHYTGRYGEQKIYTDDILAELCEFYLYEVRCYKIIVYNTGYNNLL